ncbi:hypothetical protein GT037_009269 [Alternaria burnsii]|uniref:Uncharacterized protein n=1 Tax=Alternaria burnsii TaxID=1187904 RepID=A0A8H7EBU4_9PLEO|nr:uncharacterized protein GT037_009269 [Alternaria burnsii]KAF7672768.1 hypothetical protein GT037_009269 [Alternaria burnsii]CAI9627469.1 unnamed protein product [Alternaria burnsii]
MPDVMVEPCSEYARASGPNAIKAAFMKSKSMLQPLYTTGLRNLAEPAYQSESEDERPVVRKTHTRSSFRDVMAQARGSQDFVPHEKKEEDKVTKNERERPNTRTYTPSSEVPASISDLVDFSRLQKALQDRDQYRRKEPYVLRKPFGIKDSNELPALLSMKKRNHQINQSEVRMCNHKTFVIYWDPDDPSNRNGSFISRVRDHKDRSDMTEHSCCNSRSVDVKEITMRMASSIIEAFDKQEDHHTTGHDERRKGTEPERSPSHSIVLREVHNMYSQLYRHEIRKLVKTEEAVNTKLDARERLAAQRLRQRGSASRNCDTNNTPEVDDKPDSALGTNPSKRKRKTPRQSAEEKVARNKERRAFIDIVRVRVEPLDRYKPSTVEEQQVRVTRAADRVRRECAANVQNMEPEAKFSRKSNRFAVAINVGEDDETTSPTQEAKKPRYHRLARRVTDSYGESSEGEAKVEALSKLVSHAAAIGNELEQAPESPSSSAPRGSKRKKVFSDCGEEISASPSSLSPRLMKMAK